MLKRILIYSLLCYNNDIEYGGYMWHSIEEEDIFNKLDTKTTGLSEKEANLRLKRYGLNVLPKKESESIFKIFLRQIANPIVLLLIFTVIVSIFLNELVDAIIIGFIVSIDLLLGTYQEYKAEKTAEALSKLINIDSNLIRSGKEIIKDSKQIVAGDIILLESGDKIPADIRILECQNLLVDESILTGESVAINKEAITLKEKTILSERKNMLYAGTVVLRGRAMGVVVEIGANTEIGKIAYDVNKAEEAKSPLTLRIEKFSKQICTMAIVIALILSFALFLKGYDAAMIFSSVIALSVSAMPEGLPLALTMALTVSSLRMQKKNVIVKKLNSVESLGSCTVIASDKTGTLTVNEQTAKIIMLPNQETISIDGIGYNNEGSVEYNNCNKKDIYDIALFGAINNEANIIKLENGYEYFGDSIDIAFKFLSEKLCVNINEIEILKTIPYESENKCSLVFYKINNEIHCTAKGSSEKIISMCSKMKLDDKEVKINPEKLIKQNEILASDGYRVIAVADGIVKNYTEDVEVTNLCFKGLVGFIDPVRKEVKSSIKKCEKAGIKVIMITGDHPKTAFKIAKELDIANTYDDVITKEEFDKYLVLSTFEFDEMIKQKKVFARVTPNDKLKIVESYKRMGEYIAVTGDGVNDAPAIKSANIGISMGDGTDVTKETSSMIVLDNNFTSIVSAVEEGRIAYSNIRKVIYMLLSSGFAEIFFFIVSIILNLPMPLLAIQILWLNIVTDGLQDFALSFEKGEKGIMNEKPRPPKEALFDKTLFREIALSGISMGVIVIALWFYLIKYTNVSEPLARGYVMTLMVFLQNFQVLNCCSEKYTILKHNFKSNMFVVYTVISAIILQFIVSEVPVFSKFFKIEPLPRLHLIYLFIYAGVILLIMEIYKYIQRRKQKI